MIGNKQNNFHSFQQKAMNSVFLVRYLTAVVRIFFFLREIMSFSSPNLLVIVYISYVRYIFTLNGEKAVLWDSKNLR